MKVAVVEWEISVIGGRQRTMLAFADALIELGHNVTFHANFNPEDRGREGVSLKGLLHETGLRHLRDKHIRVGMKRHFATLDQIPPDMAFADVLLLPYAGYSVLQCHLPAKRLIVWCVHPDQRLRAPVDSVWTNSESVKAAIQAAGVLNGHDVPIYVVRPPHDYKVFNRLGSACPIAHRGYDFVTVGQLIHTKGLLEFAEFVSQRNAKGCVLATSNGSEENTAILASLREFPIDIRLNSTRRTVAETMANSKFFLTFSHTESCSLALYEALAAGCIPLVRDTSFAAREQMGANGTLFETDSQLLESLRYIEELGETWAQRSSEQAQARSAKNFSREKALEELRRRL